jgi:hypothetical protein
LDERGEPIIVSLKAGESEILEFELRVCIPHAEDALGFLDLIGGLGSSGHFRVLRSVVYVSPALEAGLISGFPSGDLEKTKKKAALRLRAERFEIGAARCPIGETG